MTTMKHIFGGMLASSERWNKFTFLGLQVCCLDGREVFIPRQALFCVDIRKFGWCSTHAVFMDGTVLRTVTTVI